MEFNATFIVAFISFIVFIFIMNWILYKPIGDIVSKRKQLIDGNYNDAKENSYKSAVILQERVDKLNLTHQKNHAEYLKSVNRAKDEKDSSIREAKERSANDISEKTDSYVKESQRAKEMLKDDVVRLARMISGKFVSSEEEIDSELINKILQG